MIGKRINNPSESSTKFVRITRLSNYIRNPGDDSSGEKCIYAGARGFICDDDKSQIAEMIALASECVKSKDPIKHYIFSLKEGERATPIQVEQWVDIFLQEQGLVDHQIIYGLHQDTDNIHLHIEVNLVHPETCKVVKPNKGFDIEALHRAVARIEHEQGWQRESNARYHVLKNGTLSKRPDMDANKPLEPAQAIKDREQRTGAKSAERMAIEIGGPILRTASSWAELHELLADVGMRYEKSGSGAKVFVGEVALKASSCDRNAGLVKMEKRLGPWVPSVVTAERMTHQKPAPLFQIDGWAVYTDARHEHFKRKRLDTESLRVRHEAERQQLANEQRIERAEVFLGEWRGRGDLRNALASVLAARHAAAKLTHKERLAKERNELRARYRPWPDFEDWLREQMQPELADRWRYRLNPVNQPGYIQGTKDVSVPVRDIRSFRAEIHGSQVLYMHLDGRGVGFIDKGKIISIPHCRDSDTTLAALQLAAQKWGTFEVTGSDEYKALCSRLAAVHGFRISNPELQDDIEKQRIMLKIKTNMPRNIKKDVNYIKYTLIKSDR